MVVDTLPESAKPVGIVPVMEVVDMTNLDTLDDCIAALQRLRKNWNKPDPDLLAARTIAAEESKQTGKNYQAFIDGRYDYAYGVRTALAAIQYGRKTA